MIVCFVYDPRFRVHLVPRDTRKSGAPEKGTEFLVTP